MKLISLLTLALIVGCVADCTAQSARPADSCAPGQTAPPVGSWTWAENSHVEVFVRIPDFSPVEVPSLLMALQNWDVSHIENGSGVHFEYKGTVTEARTCDGCLTIIRGKTSDKRHGAELRAYSQRGDQIIDHAHIVIDPRYTKPETLTAIVAHEFGHSLGLLDCFSCKRGSTAMNSFGSTLKFLNVRIADRSNGIKGPTGCDLMQVRAAYKELQRVVRAAPNAQIVADEGEEPEEDDTPIVIP